MKQLNFLFILGLLSLPFGTQAQDASSRLLPNAINGNNTQGTLGVGLSIGINQKQVQINYNLSDDFFVFGSFNTTTRNVELPRFGDRLFIRTIFGPEVMLNKAEIRSRGRGYSVGGGIHHRPQKNPNHSMEFIGAFDRHRTLSILEIDSEEVDSNITITAYQGTKYSLQFNSMHAKNNWDIGYSVRLGLLKTQTWEQGEKWVVFGPTSYLLEPTFNLNYRPLGDETLRVSLQTGFSYSYYRHVIRASNSLSISSGSNIHFITGLGISYAFSQATD